MSDEMNKDSKYTLECVVITIEALEYLIEHEDQAVTPTQFADALEISRPRGYRILKTLTELEYAEYDEEAKGYFIGDRFTAMDFKRWMSSNNLPSMAHLLDELTKITGETALVVYRVGSTSIGMMEQKGEHQYQVTTEMHEFIPLHILASGRVLLAHLPGKLREEILDTLELVQYTEHTITDVDELRERIAFIRANGYELAIEDYALGMVTIAAPVIDRSLRFRLALELSIPTIRFSKEKESLYIPVIRQIARNISAGMGYQSTQRDYGIIDKG